MLILIYKYTEKLRSQGEDGLFREGEREGEKGVGNRGGGGGFHQLYINFEC